MKVGILYSVPHREYLIKTRCEKCATPHAVVLKRAKKTACDEREKTLYAYYVYAYKQKQ